MLLTLEILVLDNQKRHLAGFEMVPMKGSKQGWTRVWLMTIVVCCALGLIVGRLETYPIAIEIDECIGYRSDEKVLCTQRSRLFGLLPIDVRYYAVTEEGEKRQSERLRHY